MEEEEEEEDEEEKEEEEEEEDESEENAGAGRDEYDEEVDQVLGRIKVEDKEFEAKQQHKRGQEERARAHAVTEQKKFFDQLVGLRIIS